MRLRYILANFLISGKGMQKSIDFCNGERFIIKGDQLGEYTSINFATKKTVYNI